MKKQPYQILFENFVADNNFSSYECVSEKYNEYKKTKKFLSDYKEILLDYYKDNKSHNGVDGWVYFLKNNNDGLIKIGMTRIGMKKRLKEIGVVFKNVTVLFLIKSEMPWFLEEKLHKKFSKKNVDNTYDSEWFNLSDEDIEWVKNNYNCELYN